MLNILVINSVYNLSSNMGCAKFKAIHKIVGEVFTLNHECEPHGGIKGLIKI